MQPDYPERAWIAYNRALLEFVAAHPDRCALVSTNQLVLNPAGLVDLLAEHFGLRLDAELRGTFSPALFSEAPPGDPLPGLHALAWPEAADLLADLDGAAYIPSNGAGRIEAFEPRLLHDPAARPRMSIVTPVHDDGVFLAEALASAERGCTPDTELIIVDDGSSDPFTVGFLNRLEDRGYQVEHQVGRGLSNARNRVIRQARGTYIMLLDADNRLSPDYVPHACEVLDAQPSVAVVYGDRREFGLRSRVVRVPDFDWDAMLQHNLIDACAAFRRQAWLDAGGFNESLPALEDWDFWLGVWRAGWDFHHLPEVGFDYRVRAGSLTDWLVESGRLKHLRHHVRDRHTNQKRRRPRGRPRARGRRPWKASASGRAAAAPRPAPDYLIVGAMKSGTTSLFEHLVSHPGIITPKVKEIHYFDLQYFRGPDWYLEQLGVLASRQSAGLSGEASPYYLFHPAVPERVAQSRPDVRLIALLRDPVSRAVSHHHHSHRLGLDDLPLEQALAREEERLAGTTGALLRGDAHRIPAHQHFSLKARGHYAEQLEAWLRFFPPEQIMVVQSETLFDDPGTELPRIADFLGLATLPPRPLDRLNSGDYPAAPPAVIEQLDRHFSPWNERLEALLESRWNQQLDLSRWRRP